MAQRAAGIGVVLFSSVSYAARRGDLRCTQGCSVRAGWFLVPALRAGLCCATRRLSV
ncbi:hypothetical protein A2U01_0074707 [Trifolium medium]|uniref:Uncharacterized protein n=1 Tax=Trifolium medium TaxID=97028 RepID=A0A392T001_9FABA|nr:hypothetical protein [Trifolium medium]